MSLALKVLWSSSWLAVAQNMLSRFSVNPVLFNPHWLTMIDELYLHSYPNEPNKSPWRKRIKALLPWEIGHVSSPSRSCLGSLFLHPWRNRGAALKTPDIWCPTWGLRTFRTCTDQRLWATIARASSVTDPEGCVKAPRQQAASRAQGVFQSKK